MCNYTYVLVCTHSYAGSYVYDKFIYQFQTAHNYVYDYRNYLLIRCFRTARLIALIYLQDLQDAFLLYIQLLLWEI